MGKTWLIIVLLLIGVIVRLTVTSSGNFIFHMDNARDMVDIREMVVLGKWRLIGPTSGIEGVFTGPGWYYIAAIPFILSGGDPYASILLQIFFWTVGGFFLLHLVKRWGVGVVGVVGGIWVSSNLIILNSQHSLSPNPIILLMPLFIFLAEKFWQSNRQLFNLFCWLMAGLFFQLEMAFGIFMPAVMIVLTLLRVKKNRWSFIGLGLLTFGVTLLPQVIFELRHQFLMTHSLINYLQTSPGVSVDWMRKVISLFNLYRGVYSGLMMNWNILTLGSLFILVGALGWGWTKSKWRQDSLVIISLLILIIPLLGYLILPIRAMAWHVQASMSALLILLGYSLGRLGGLGILGRLGVLGVVLVVIVYSVYNLEVGYIGYLRHLSPSNNPSLMRNELAVVDYIYREANGKNFKVYTYMPSIIDYPYQYLFWWRGLNKYGYLPTDYAYLPHQPKYISNKDLLRSGTNPESSGLIFLIKEPDQRGERHLWLNSFNHLPLVSQTKLGAIEIEERTELP